MHPLVWLVLGLVLCFATPFAAFRLLRRIQEKSRDNDRRLRRWSSGVTAATAGLLIVFAIFTSVMLTSSVQVRTPTQEGAAPSVDSQNDAADSTANDTMGAATDNDVPNRTPESGAGETAAAPGEDAESTANTAGAADTADTAGTTNPESTADEGAEPAPVFIDGLIEGVMGLPFAGAIQTNQDIFPIEDFDDVENMLMAVNRFYNGKQTSVEKINDFALSVYMQIEQKRSRSELFKLGESFELKEAQPLPPQTAAETLEECDMQISGCFSLMDRNEKLTYQSIEVVALNALPLCTEAEDLKYYSQLALYGLLNECVLCQETEHYEFVSIFYRMSQVYDFLSGTMLEADKEDKNRMYFAAAGMAYISYRSLAGLGFSRSNIPYWADSWYFYLTLLYRVGTYMDAKKDYFSRMEDICKVIRGLYLNESEKRYLCEIEGYLDRVKSLMD